jgi:hypothetical protein
MSKLEISDLLNTISNYQSTSLNDKKNIKVSKAT